MLSSRELHIVFIAIAIAMIGCGRMGFEQVLDQAPSSDASGPVPQPERCLDDDPCNGIDDDCDGSVDEDGCPGGCTGVSLQLRGYVVCTARSNADARLACAVLGGALARIDDDNENAWLRARADELAIPFVWIGARDEAVEGTWRWEDNAQFWQGDETGMPTGLYVNWQTGAPNNSGNKEDCALLWMDGRWQDFTCTDSNGFVCEVP